MGNRRLGRCAGRVAALVAPALVIACGGVSSVDIDQGPPDVAGPAVKDANVQDAQTEDVTIVPSDSGADGPVAPEVGFDGGTDADADVAAVSCQIVWPQMPGLMLAQDAVQMVIDKAGNAYLAITYGNPPLGGGAVGPFPPLDLGVSSPRYVTGVAIAKVDPFCDVVWMRELGTSSYGITAIQGAAIVVDSASNVEVLGSFYGTADLGSGTIDTWDAGPVFMDDSFLVRLDPSGTVVFTDVFRSGGLGVAGTSLAIGTGDVTSLAAAGTSGADFGDGPVSPTWDAGTETGVGYFVQLDATGKVTRQEALPAGSTDNVLAADGDGGLWVTSETPGGLGSLTRLDPAGVPLWSVPVASLSLALGADREVVEGFGDAGQQLQAYSRDGTVLWGCNPKAIPPSEGLMFLDSSGHLILPGTFGGAVGFVTLDSTCAALSSGVWGGAGGSERFQTAGVDGAGNVVIVGSTTVDEESTSLFLVRLQGEPPSDD
jgi:hypothetical protein